MSCLRGIFRTSSKPDRKQRTSTSTSSTEQDAPLPEDNRSLQPPKSLRHKLSFTAAAGLHSQKATKPTSSKPIQSQPPPNPHQDNLDLQTSEMPPPNRGGIRKKASKAKARKDAGGYFNATPGGASAGGTESRLDKMFDDLRNSDEDGKDSLGTNSMMNYLSEDLGLDMATGEAFVALELLQAPSLQEMTRKGFIEGWKDTGVSASKTAQAQHVRQLIRDMSSNPAYYKKIYRYTFVAGKGPDNKALSLEDAIEFWRVQFAPPGRPWKTASYDWLELWIEFLNAKWTRSVNKDMWNQTLEFSNKTMEDETLGFWSEEQAWPSVIDDFVAWCKKEKGIGVRDAMDTDN